MKDLASTSHKTLVFITGTFIFRYRRKISLPKLSFLRRIAFYDRHKHVGRLTTVPVHKFLHRLATGRLKIRELKIEPFVADVEPYIQYRIRTYVGYL